ncbi:MAG: hypothetical protein AABX14_05620 [Candidatus Aenigmatarchaeota archaeon]
MTHPDCAKDVHVLMEAGDRVRGERIICQYRKERHAVLVHLTGGHKGIQKVIEGLPAEAIVDKVWRYKHSPQ